MREADEKVSWSHCVWQPEGFKDKPGDLPIKRKSPAEALRRANLGLKIINHMNKQVKK